jgi:hypothetical protein
MDLKRLRNVYSHLDIKERPKIKDQWSFLRWQAIAKGTEHLDLPAIPRLRAAVCETVTFRRLIAHSDTLEGLADALRTYYNPEPEVKEAA